MAGRPKKMTIQTLGKLKEAFLWGCSDAEACVYAGIHPDTLYEFQKKSPGYSEQKESYKSYPFLVARKSIVMALKNDPHLALKYLERKKNDEFSLKHTVNQNISTERIEGFNYIVPDEQVPEFTAHYPDATVIKRSDYTNS
ncbi:MAG: hypothetical protein WAX66_02125 [Patescibacteria group bacterium]